MRKKLNFDKIKRWDEALPLGNARLGALLWGDESKLRVSLDRADLWDLRQSEEVSAKEFCSKKLVELIKKGEAGAKEMSARFVDFYEKYPYPTKIPAGAIEFYFDGKISQFSLNIHNGLASYKNGENKAELFCHIVNKLIFIRVSADIKMQLKAPNYSKRRTSSEIIDQSAQQEGLISLGYPECRYFEEDDCVFFIQPTYEDNAYGVFVRALNSNESVYYVIDVAKGKIDDKQWIRDAKKRLSEAVKLSFDEQFFMHRRIFEFNMSCSKICVPDQEVNFLWELYQYYLICNCDELSPPVALQGVWTADNEGLPPWKGDFHNDLNVQMSYWTYARNNHLDAGKSLVNYILKNKASAKSFAERFYGVDGYCMPSTTDLIGNPMGGWAQYSYNVSNHCWLCHMLYQYYEYSLDEDLLKNEIYPYFIKSFECVKKVLFFENEQLKTLFTSSPEIYGNGQEAWLSGISNYDLSLYESFFSDFIIMQDRFCGDIAEPQKYLLAVKNSYSIDGTGYKISEGLPYFESHRHLGHLMSIYPLELINVKDNATVIEKSLETIEEKGYSWFVGYSFTWLACLYAKAFDGKNALRCLKIFSDSFISPNGFHLNGDYKKHGVCNFNYRPFTLEGNFAYACAVNEMLLTEIGEEIYLLPAVPKEWLQKEVVVENFRLKYGLLIDFLYKENQFIVKVTNETDSEMSRVLCFGKQKINLKLQSGLNSYIFKI